MLKVVYALLIILVTAITVQIPYTPNSPDCTPQSSSGS
jgi:hypothetical protein